MSRPGTIYFLQVENCEKTSNQYTDNNQLLYVYISDTDNQIPDDMEPTTIILTGAETPIRFSTIDNDEDVFTVIKSTQLTLRVLTEDTIDLSTFAGGSAQRWLVEVFRDDPLTIFKGFLVVADMSEEFMPHPHELELVANDGLGLLKEIPLTDDNGDNPTGYNRIADYLTWALSKTGLSLNLKTVFNIQHGFGSVAIDHANFSDLAGGFIYFPLSIYSYLYVGAKFTVSCTGANNGTTFTVVANNGGANIQVDPTPVDQSNVLDAVFTDVSSGHFFNKIYLDAKTFEDEVGTSINCYEVIKRILGEEACLFQRNGYWWILRIDELETGDIYITEYNTSAQILSDFQPYSFNKEIGKDNYVIFFSEEATKVQVDMRHKEVKLIYNYNQWKEILCNADFNKGDFIEDLPDELIDGEYYKVSTYELFCSTKIRKHYSTNVEDSTTSFNHFVKRIYIDSARAYEKEKFLVVEPRTVDSLLYTEYVKMTAPIYVMVNDRLGVYVNYKFPFSPSGAPVEFGGPYTIIYLKFIGDSGNIYFLYNTENNGAGQWLWLNEATSSPAKTWVFNWDGYTDYGQWQPISFETLPMPENGEVYIYLASMNQITTGPDPSADDVNIFYSGLSVEYKPYVRSSTTYYKGQYHKISQGIENKITREREVYISDSPKRLFKGALHFFSDPGYSLTRLFYNKAVFPNGPTSIGYLHPYGEIQAFDVWNQFRLEMRIFQAQCQGLDSGSLDALSEVGMISLLHKFELKDTNTHTTNKRFKLLTYDINWHLCDWNGVLREVYDTIEGKDYTGNEFKYLI